MKYLKKKPRGRIGAVQKGLIEEGVISPPPRSPREKERSLQYADGLDIIYDLKTLGPERFEMYSEKLLALVEWECSRYPNPPGVTPEPYQYFATFDVRLQQTGRKKGVNRSFTASRTSDISSLIAGVEMPQHGEPPEAKDLGTMVDRIKQLAGEYKPGVYLHQQRPYRAVRLTIAIRTGMHEKRMEILDDMARKRAEEAAEVEARLTEEHWEEE